MRYSLGDYRIDEVEKMERPNSNFNYDVYDTIMFNVAKEYDKIVNNDDVIKQNQEDLNVLKGLAMFAFTYILNRRNYIKDSEKIKLIKLLSKADEVCKKDSDSLAKKEYFNFRHCLSQYLQRTCGLDINNKTTKR